MKDKSFVIKVGDLLQEWWKSDSIEFEWKITKELPELDNKWISWTVILRSINQDSLYVSLENIVCNLEDICDRCWINYKRNISVAKYISRFVISEKIKKEEQETSDEEISDDKVLNIFTQLENLNTFSSVIDLKNTEPTISKRYFTKYK